VPTTSQARPSADPGRTMMALGEPLRGARHPGLHAWQRPSGIVHVIATGCLVSQQAMTRGLWRFPILPHGDFGAIAFGIRHQPGACVLAARALSIEQIKVRRNLGGRRLPLVCTPRTLNPPMTPLGVKGGVGYAMICWSAIEASSLEERMTLCHMRLRVARCGYGHPDCHTFRATARSARCSTGDTGSGGGLVASWQRPEGLTSTTKVCVSMPRPGAHQVTWGITPAGDRPSMRPCRTRADSNQRAPLAEQAYSTWTSPGWMAVKLWMLLPRPVAQRSAQ